MRERLQSIQVLLSRLASRRPCLPSQLSIPIGEDRAGKIALFNRLREGSNRASKNGNDIVDHERSNQNQCSQWADRVAQENPRERTYECHSDQLILFRLSK